MSSHAKPKKKTDQPQSNPENSTSESPNQKTNTQKVPTHQNNDSSEPVDEPV